MTTQDDEGQFIAIPKTLWLAVVEELRRNKERIQQKDTGRAASPARTVDVKPPTATKEIERHAQCESRSS